MATKSASRDACPRLDDKRHEAWRLFLTAHARLLDSIDAEMAAAGLLPTTWYDVLVTLETAPQQRLRMTELAAAVLLSRSGLTRLVDRLEKAGLLRREACPSDRRCVYAVLTRQGAAARKKSWPAYRQCIVQLFGRHLSDTEAETIGAALGRIVAAADEGRYGAAR